MIILLVGVLLSTALFSGFPEIWMDQPAGAAAATSTALPLLLLLAAAKEYYWPHHKPRQRPPTCFGSIDLLVLESIGRQVDSGCFRDNGRQHDSDQSTCWCSNQ